MTLKRGNNPNPADLKKKPDEPSPGSGDNRPEVRGKGATAKEPAAKAAPAPSATPPEERSADGSREMYLAVKKRIRDPYADIMYDLNTPKPAGNEGWCRVQLAAGVLKKYNPNEQADKG